MKRFLIILLVFVCHQNVFSQAKLEKVDPENIPERLFTKQKVYTVAFPNKAKVLDEIELEINRAVEINDGFKIGKNLTFNFNFDSLPKIIRDGEIKREIEIISPGSNTLSLNFSQIELSESAKLFIINDEEHYILGPITANTASRTKNLDPGFIPGDKIRLLLVESEFEDVLSKIAISKVGHSIFDFFGVENYKSSRSENENCYGFDCSSPCLQNIACFPELNLESKGVVLITQTNSLNDNLSLRGSGFLINNGAQDKKPLVAATIHGISGLQLDEYKFIFHYKSPQCTPTTVGSISYFIQGATNLFSDASNDLRLMELSVNPYQNPVFSGNPVSYLGWSIIDEPIDSVKSIGHPRGDVQKFFSGGPASTFLEPDENLNVWKFTPTRGFAETGSSGSPLFNPSKRVIGVNQGGEDFNDCINPDDYDIFAVRLGISWPFLCQYLDPNDEGIVAMNTITTFASIKILPSISGPENLCSSNTFSLDNAPIDIPVSWSIVQGANLISSPSSGVGKDAVISPVNFSAKGSVKIRFTVDFECFIKVYDKTFWVGTPDHNLIVAASWWGPPIEREIDPSTSTFASVDYVTPILGQTHGIQEFEWKITDHSNWDIYSQTGGGIVLNRDVEIDYWQSPLPVQQDIYIRVKNLCGWSYWKETTWDVIGGCSFCSFTVYPNPSNGEIRIRLENDGENKSGKINLPSSLSYMVIIYNDNGELIWQKETSEHDETIPTEYWEEGIYYVHIIHPEGEFRKKIIVRH